MIATSCWCSRCEHCPEGTHPCGRETQENAGCWSSSHTLTFQLTQPIHVDRMQVKLMMPWSKTKHLASGCFLLRGQQLRHDAAGHIVASIQPLDETPTTSKMSHTTCMPRQKMLAQLRFGDQQDQESDQPSFVSNVTLLLLKQGWIRLLGFVKTMWQLRQSQERICPDNDGRNCCQWWWNLERSYDDDSRRSCSDEWCAGKGRLMGTVIAIGGFVCIL